MARGTRTLSAALPPLLALALTACQGSSSCTPKGPCQPTCAGVVSEAYADYASGHKAFTRSTKDGSLTATLEDVSWLRFEGEEAELLKKHRAYFEQGYTTFQILLRTKDFTQPTGETFVLEDSRGARLTGRPVTYQAGMGMEQEKFANRFSVSFRHAITRELDWIRLTRAADGGVLEWVFGEGAGGAQPAQAPQPAGRVVKGTPLSQWHEEGAGTAGPADDPQDAARATAAGFPAASSVPSSAGRPSATVVPPTSYANLPPAGGSGRPVNLLNHPEALRPAGSTGLGAAAPAFPPPAEPVPAPASVYPDVPAAPAREVAPPPTPRRVADPSLPPSGPLPPPTSRPVR